MTRIRTALSLFALLSLLLVACGNDTSDQGDTSPDGQGDEAASVDDPDDAPEGEGGEGEEPPDGVAATVDDTEITVTTVEDLYDEVAESPAFAPQLEGENAELMSSTLRSQILGQLIVQEIILEAAAEDYDVEVTDETLDATFAEYADQMGGEEQLVSDLEASGISRDVFEALELPLLTALTQLEEEFGVEEGASGGGATEGQPSEAQRELSSWAVDHFAAADVTVSSEYGTWNPQSGQVQPDGMPQAPPPGAVPAPEDAPAPEDVLAPEPAG